MSSLKQELLVFQEIEEIIWGFNILNGFETAQEVFYFHL
jgi:hypothetical protein